MKLWNEYVDLLRPAGELIAKTWAPDSSQLQADLCRQLAMNLSQGYFLYCQATTAHPDFAPFENSVFLLQPNPDAVYHYAPVAGDGVYRVVGQRGTVPVAGFATGKVMIGMGLPPGPGYDNYDLDDLTLAKDGSFEVLFSAERPADHRGDWRRLHPEARFLMLRQFSYDWGGEQDVRVAIERLDTPPLKPRLTPADIDQQLRALFGTYVGCLTQTALGAVGRVQAGGWVNSFHLHDFQDLGNSASWPQAYYECVYEIAPDEALILETALPAKPHYWNVQVVDALWNQVELVHRQSSLNGHQAELDPDGKFRAVLSLEDPGVANWLDAGGHTRGMLIGRWYRCSSHPTPSLTKVKLADLRRHLPDSVPSITPAQRTTRLRQRRIGAQLRRRW